MDNAINHARAFSSHELVNSSESPTSMPDDISLGGIATDVRLLLKLIQENHEASAKDIDERKTQRIDGMIRILDDVKTRIEKSQSAGRRRMAELRRCNTDLRPNRPPPPRDKKPQEPVPDEKDKLKKQLSASLAPQKSLEIMCSSLGKEKEIMSSELAKKVHEISEMEELVNDLRVQNKSLLTKLKACASEREKKSHGGESQGNIALQDQNRVLSEQLLKSLDSYRSLKRKYKDTKEENVRMQTTMEEIGVKVAAGLERIHSLTQKMAAGNDLSSAVADEISRLEQMFERLNPKIGKNEKNEECSKPKTEINSIVA